MRSLTAYAHQKAKQSFRNSWVLYLMFVPAAVWMICFRLLPIPGILIAFKDYNVFDGFAASPWVGFKHFQQMFTRTRFLNVIEHIGNQLVENRCVVSFAHHSVADAE